MATYLDKPISREMRAAVDNRPPRAIIVTLYPGGIIGIREKGRKATSEVKTDVASVWASALMRKALPTKTPTRRRLVSRGLLHTGDGHGR